MLILVPYLIFLLCCVIGISWYGAAARRYGLATVIVADLAALTRQNLPLATGLELAAEHETGKRAVVLRRIGRLLQQGLSLHDAVHLGWPGCPAAVSGLIDVAERQHHLPPALQQLEADLAQRAQRARRFTSGDYLYPVVLLLFAWFVVAAIMVVVIPKFEEIFRDFDVKLPPATVALISASNWFIGKGPARDGSQDHIPGCFLVALIFVSFVVLFYLQRPRRPRKPHLFSRLADYVRWFIPGWHRCEHAAGVAQAAGCIRFGLLAGIPLHRALRNAADLDVNIVLRARLLRWADDVERGVPGPQAARNARVGAFVEWAFATPAAGSALPDSLAFVHDYYQAAAYHWALILRQLLWPLTVIALGVVVGFIVYSLFTPLAALINGTLEQIAP